MSRTLRNTNILHRITHVFRSFWVICYFFSRLSQNDKYLLATNANQGSLIRSFLWYRVCSLFSPIYIYSTRTLTIWYYITFECMRQSENRTRPGCSAITYPTHHLLSYRKTHAKKTGLLIFILSSLSWEAFLPALVKYTGRLLFYLNGFDH